MYVDNVDAVGNSATAFMDTWDDSTNPTIKSRLRLINAANPAQTVEWDVSVVANSTGYRTITLANGVGTGTLTNGATFMFDNSRSGNAGATGANGATGASGSAGGTGATGATGAAGGATDFVHTLTADENHLNNTSQNNWFFSNPGASLAANRTYEFEGWLMGTNAGTNNWALQIGFAGAAAATLTRIQWFALGNKPAANPSMTQFTSTVAANVTGAGFTGGNFNIFVKGIAVTSTAGVLQPVFQYNTAPGAGGTIKRGSFFRFRDIGSDSFVSQGTWP